RCDSWNESTYSSLEFTVVSLFFFFSSRRRHTRCYRDWSSDVCSSDLMDIDEMDIGQEETESSSAAAATAVAMTCAKARAASVPNAEISYLQKFQPLQICCSKQAMNCRLVAIPSGCEVPA